MKCRACGEPNRDGARFCGACGDALARACEACGAENLPAHRFCDQCGAALGAAAAPALPRRQGPELAGERKQVTVMFADLMGSMNLAENVDPEEWRAIMERFYAILCDGVHRFEGTVDKFTGDGIMALFGAPIAHEDHAVRAGYAALHLHDSLGRYGEELRRTHGLSFSVRVGLNSGEVVVGGLGDDLSLEYTAIGHTVGLAQRMESLAEPGATYMTEATAGLMAGYLDTRDLGEFSVKGASRAVRVYALAGAGSARSRLDLSARRGFSRFVGRGDELSVLEAALHRAQDGQGRVVGVVGEAGVGKSRLCHELIELATERGIPVFHVAAAAHRRASPFSTALELIRIYFGVEHGQSDQAVRERVATRLIRLDPAFADDVPLLLDFLGVPDPARPVPRMDPDARQRRLLAVVARLTQAQSAREPALTVVEDLHWIDPGSELLLGALVDALRDTRALLVTNFRPEYRAEWMTRPHYQQLPVVPLGAEATESLLGELLGSHPSLDGLAEELRARTGGNPFFAEEVVRSLAEEGVLAGERGAHTLARAVEHIRVPPTVESVLAARIDRLPPRDKALLQAAAVLGREFSKRLLQQVSGLSETELAAGLGALTDGDFLQPHTLYPEPQHSFRHALTQEVAHRSQLAESRARTHAAAAAAIEELYPDSLDERAAVLANHWDAAGEPLQAAGWSARAAAWAGISAPVEALRWWRRVSALVARVPLDDETRALAVVARVWILQFGWRLGVSDEEVEAAYAEGRSLAAQSDDRALEALLNMSYGATQAVGGSVPADGLAAMRESDRIAREIGASHLRVGLSLALAYFEFVIEGRVEPALAVCDELIALADGDATMGAGLAVACPLAWLHMMRAHLLIYQCRIDEARAAQAHGFRLVAEHDDRETEGWLNQPFIWAAWATGCPLGAAAAANRVLELAESSGSAFSHIWALALFGTGQTLDGNPEAGIPYLERAISLARRERTALEGEPFHLAMLAEARLALGDAAGALAAAREAAEVTERRGLHGAACGTNLALARALLATGSLEAAGEALDAGIERAQTLGFLIFLPRLQLVRAELCTARGDGAAAAAAREEAHRGYAALGLEPVPAGT